MKWLDEYISRVVYAFRSGALAGQGTMTEIAEAADIPSVDGHLAVVEMLNRGLLTRYLLPSGRKVYVFAGAPVTGPRDRPSALAEHMG